ncbi:MAG TPA: PAS domain S-box protein [Mycobacteriales bacterium]|jgi:PAS domain S-box-containing protein|nr:PAS domain S-box protein [Mycobacteriales bacterium]
MSQGGIEGNRLGPDAYRAIFEYSLDGVMFTVPDGSVLAANPAACQLLGRSEEEIRSLGRQGLTDPTDPRWVTGLTERARTGRTRLQARMLRGDGTSFEVDLSSVLFETADGERRGCIIFRDLSDRMAVAQELALAQDRDRIARNLHATVLREISEACMEAHSLLAALEGQAARGRAEALTASLDDTLVSVRHAIYRLGGKDERRYQTLVENSPVAVAVYRGRDARFVYANQRTVELYGARDLDDMLRHHAYEVIPPDLLPGWEQRVQRVLDGAVIRQGVFRLLRFDGREISVEANAVKVRFDGESCVQLEVHEIPQRKTVRLPAEDAGQAASGVSAADVSRA